MAKKTFYLGVVCLAIIIYLSFNFAVDLKKFKGINSDIKNTILSSLDIEYNHKTHGLDKVFTTEFIKKIDKYFYKQDKRPFEILEVNKITDDELDIRVRDKEGEYIQNVHFIRMGNKYYISEILYDI